MNLHSIARAAIGMINPEIPVILLRNTGATTIVDGHRSPAFSPPVYGTMQVQGISGKDLQLTAGLNIQGILRAVFLMGVVSGVNKAAGSGGDILKFPEYPGGVMRDWKVVLIKDSYPDWTSAIVAMQSDIIPI